MAELDGVWDVRRTGGALPPLVGVRKRIQGTRGETARRAAFRACRSACAGSSCTTGGRSGGSWTCSSRTATASAAGRPSAAASSGASSCDDVLGNREPAAAVYARKVRRVVVTGLGAITPIGGDAASTWESAVEGRSGVDWIRSFDAVGLPGADRGRGQGLRPDLRRVAEGGAQARSERPTRAWARRRRRSPTRASTGRTATTASGSSSGRRSAVSTGSWNRRRCCASAARRASRRTSSRTCSSTRLRGSSPFRSASAGPTMRRCRRARPVRTRWARARSSCAAATRTRCSPAAASRACTR